MSAPRALITGITGQDGSYLAELLLDRGYEVHGMVRRASTEKSERIEHIRERITLHQGDLLDQRSLVDTLRASNPDEIYNLAAMSFVAVSWIQPTLTAEFTGVGVTRLLEAMREVCPEARFYQASSSEMFGKVREVPQNESTPFYPRSPYGVAKAYGHFITVNYRESYDLHATSGILFNHECLRANSPLLTREDGVVRVVAARDLMPLADKGRSTQQWQPDRFLEIWAGDHWTPITLITATRRRTTDPDHRLTSIEARGGIVQCTAHHRLLDADWEQVAARDVEPEDRLALADEWPETEGWTSVSHGMAQLLGYLAADGYVSADGGSITFRNNDAFMRTHVAQLWSQCFLGRSREELGVSGFDRTVETHAVGLTGSSSAGLWLREQLYTRSGHKQVPRLVLNADTETQFQFLDGYYAGDGLKRGNGLSTKTNSPVLAQGVCWMFANNGYPASVYAEHRAGKTYYQLNLRSRSRVGAKGQHLAKDPAEVRRVVDIEPTEDDGWVFDLETESGVFCAGIGRLVVHNSPRRGLEFVTRKITWHAAAIKAGKAKELALGNLDAQRDWGYAKDYVDAMWRMLQCDDAEDFVIATGKAHSVRECVEIAFDHVGLPWEEYVRIDESFVRPAEVDHLIGDYSKAKAELGWEPTTTFEELIRLMVEADTELLSR
jgi:GDPmannose 4,6-dehydratase